MRHALIIALGFLAAACDSRPEPAEAGTAPGKTRAAGKPDGTEPGKADATGKGKAAAPSKQAPTPPGTGQGSARTTPNGTEQPRPRPGHTLSWPRDEKRVIARVDGRELTFGDLARHIKERHDPFFLDFLQTPGGARCFSQERFGADWVRHFADITALEAEARQRGLDPEAADAALGAALKAGFEAWLPSQKPSPDMTQKLMNFYLARFQRLHGLQTELKGWLDFLVPETDNDGVLRKYFQGAARTFGGTVTFSHILVAHRDPHTLVLLDEEGRQRAWDKMTDIRARLKKDGSNFAELARRYSEERKTAARGGRLNNVERFHPILPAILCRTAWGLRDGEVSEPVESQYGLHLIQRISFVQKQLIIYTPAAKPVVQAGYRRQQQENLVFDTRRKMRVKLRY